MVGIFNIGVGAIQNAQLGFMVTEHNIANATTPGYARQRAVQYSNNAIGTGSGYVGQGAHVQTIERLYDDFTQKQLNQAQSSVSYLDAYANEIGQINGMLADASAGLSPAIQNFYKGVQQAAADPTSVAARQSVVSTSQALTSRFQALDYRIYEQQIAVNGHIDSAVKSVNNYAAQIADLNQQIVLAESKAGGQPPNDLYDQRDHMVAELNKIIKVQTSVNTNNTYNVMIGTGQQLVVGNTVVQMVAMPSSDDPARLTVGLKGVSGPPVEYPESFIVGGSLGGILNFRSEYLDRTANELGRIAASIALTFNTQHSLGQDLQGQIAGDANFVGNFFQISEPRVLGNGRNPPGAPVVSAALVNPPPYNGNFYTNLTNSDYRLEQVAGQPLTLRRLTDNHVWQGNSINDINQAMLDPATGSPSEGFTLSQTPGPITDGTSYLISPTRELARNISVDPRIAADVRQLALAAPTRNSVGAGNTGNAAITAGSVSLDYSSANYLTDPPTNPTYYQSPAANTPSVLTFDGALAQFSLNPPAEVRVTINGNDTIYASGDPIPYTNGATISFNGISFEISGTPKNGDTFEIAKNVNGVSDNRNAMLLGKLQTQSTMSGQKASYQGVYAQLVSDAGNKGSEIKARLEAQEVLLSQSQDQRQSLSGVNLDEEAANLMRYQQALQAASKMLSIAGELFDSILAI